ncbi:MAG: DNA topoisomerase, partial [Candidatus Pacearchaeota archaeon]|nr:DNA topoisomerase [Candidatus Pacearchaeota archaeon]
SRALMEAIKRAGKFRIMSSGRVQGPALHLIVEKELEIEKFKPEAYWQIFIKLKGHELELKYEKDIHKKEEIEKFKKLEGKKGLARTEKSERNIPPGFPFDLTNLQREAYRLFGINPARTLQIAQNLYLAGLISYPRTSSQKIPEAIKPREILKKLPQAYTVFVTRDKPVEGGKSDPAHPSIYPTGEHLKLIGEEEKIYSIILKRFIACFCDDAIIKDKKVVFECDEGKFKASGLEIKEKGWMHVYPLKIEEREVEDIEGEKIIKKLRIEEKMTQPPRRYTPASIITELEKRNLGTKATRANIIETLYARNYIKEQSIQATPLGISLIKTLEKYSPVIIDEKLTRDFEKDMVEIERAKKGLEEKEEHIIKKAEVSIKKIAEDFKQHEDKIGKELVSATEENYKLERAENELNECPVCKKGKLRILFNKRFRRSFVACNSYPECKTTFSLPPGLIKKTDKICEACGFPMLLAIRKEKRPWMFCFNPNCKTRLEYEKSKEKK